MSAKHTLNAQALRIVLIIALLLLIAGGTAGFLLIRVELVKKASETAEISARATNSQSRVQELKNAQTALLANEAVEKKVQNMIATNVYYTYQDQIVTTLKTLGDTANVKVTNVDFTTSTQLSASTPAPAAAAPGAAPAAPINNIPGDVKLTQANITVSTPLQYDSLLKFLRYIEQNTMSMKVSKISLSKASDDKGKMLVNCDVLTIGVYMR